MHGSESTCVLKGVFKNSIICNCDLQIKIYPHRDECDDERDIEVFALSKEGCRDYQQQEHTKVGFPADKMCGIRL